MNANKDLVPIGNQNFTSLSFGLLTRLNSGDNLYARRPRAQHSDSFPIDVVLSAPSRAVYKVTFEGMESRNIRPFPVVQDPRSVYEDMAVILNYLAGVYNMDSNPPDSFCLVPCCLADIVPQLDISMELILACDPLEILQDLVPGRITKLINNATWRTGLWCGLLMGPLRVRLPGELIVVRWNVTSAPRVSVSMSIIKNSSPGCDEMLACSQTRSLLHQSFSHTQSA